MAKEKLFEIAVLYHENNTTTTMLLNPFFLCDVDINAIQQRVLGLIDDKYKDEYLDIKIKEF